MTPEERAEKAYPMDHYTHQVQREAYAAALRDDAARDERISENAKLRALVQVLVDALSDSTGHAQSAETMYGVIGDAIIEQGQESLATAKEAGFSPTNTEDNG